MEIAFVDHGHPARDIVTAQLQDDGLVGLFEVSELVVDHADAPSMGGMVDDMGFHGGDELVAGIAEPGEAGGVGAEEILHGGDGDFSEELLFGGVVVVQAGGAHADGLGDVLHAGGVVAALVKEVECGGGDLVAASLVGHGGRPPQ